MPTMADFCERLQERLGVDSSYLDHDIPSTVQRCMLKLLRDYNFPKALATVVYDDDDLEVDQQEYPLPDFVKKVLQVWFSDQESGTPVYGEPLLRREHFVLPDADGVSRYYWQAGTSLWTDIKLSAPITNIALNVVYQSNSPVANLGWLLDDFEDILFSLCMFRLSAELSKAELANTWAALWQEDQRSLAIYTNELEFGNIEMLMRGARPPATDRYPIQ